MVTKEVKRDRLFEGIMEVREQAAELKQRLHEDNCTDLDEVVTEQAKQMVEDKIWVYMKV